MRSAALGQVAAALEVSTTRRQVARGRFPARPAVTSWPATERSQVELRGQLSAEPFTLRRPNSEQIRSSGVSMLLDWLDEQSGTTWQQRWLASGAEAAGARWRQVTTTWLQARDEHAQWRQGAVTAALMTAISADAVRPSLRWLVEGGTGKGAQVRYLARARDPDGFTSYERPASPHRRCRPPPAGSPCTAPR